MANLFHLTLSAALCATLAMAAPRDLTVSWNTNAAKPVNVTLYYETLCPYCSRFMQNQLFPVWEKVKDDDLMSVELRPYGNARVSRFPCIMIVVIVIIVTIIISMVTFITIVQVVVIIIQA